MYGRENTGSDGRLTRRRRECFDLASARQRLHNLVLLRLLLRPVATHARTHTHTGKTTNVLSPFTHCIIARGESFANEQTNVGNPCRTDDEGCDAQPSACCINNHKRTHNHPGGQNEGLENLPESGSLSECVCSRWCAPTVGQMPSQPAAAAAAAKPQTTQSEERILIRAAQSPGPRRSRRMSSLPATHTNTHTHTPTPNYRYFVLLLRGDSFRCAHSMSVRGKGTLTVPVIRQYWEARIGLVC